MGDMSVCHDKIIVADPGYASPFGGPSVDRHVLFDGIVVADNYLGRLEFITYILGRSADGRKGADGAVVADRSFTLDHDMAADAAAFAYPGACLDHTVGPDLGIGRYFGILIDNSCWMYHFPGSFIPV